MSTPALRLHNIQGNSIGGFNKDFVSLLFLKFSTPALARSWIKEITDAEFGVAKSSSEAVLKFNAQFKALRASGVQPETVIAAAWTNLGLTHQGLKALGVKASALASFPEAFKQGMAARKDKLGDLDRSDPSKWKAPFKRPADVHAVLIVAADSEADLSARLQAITSKPAFPLRPR